MTCYYCIRRDYCEDAEKDLEPDCQYFDPSPMGLEESYDNLLTLSIFDEDDEE